MQKNTVSITALSLLVVAAGLFFYTKNRIGEQDIPDPALAAFKAQCEIYSQSPYQDPVFGFRVAFTDDQVICLSRNRVEKTHEVYIWEKSAFESNNLSGSFKEVILGKISVNPRKDLPQPNVLGQFSAVVGDESVEGDVITSPSCKSSECPTARRITIQRFGEIVSIEEYSEQLNLFDRIQL